MAVGNNPAVNTPNPADTAKAITTGEVFTKTARALYFGTGGTVTVTMENGDNVDFSGIVAGTILPVRCTKATFSGVGAVANVVALF